WHASRHPDRVHVQLLSKESVRAVRYGELYERARTVARHLVLNGLAPRERAAIMLPTSEEYLTSFLGVLLAGGVPVPIYPPLRADSVDDHLTRHSSILRNAAVSLLIVAAEIPVDRLQSSVESLRHVIAADRLKDAVDAVPL